MSEADVEADRLHARYRLLRQLLGLSITAKGEVDANAARISPEDVAYDLVVAATVALFAAAGNRQGERPEGEPVADIDFVRSVLGAMGEHLLGEDAPAEMADELREIWNEAVEEAIPFLARKRAAQSRIIVPGGAR